MLGTCANHPTLETLYKVRVESMARLIFLNRYYYPDESATSQILTDLTFYLSELGYEVAVVTGRHLIDDPEANLPSVERSNGILIYRP